MVNTVATVSAAPQPARPVSNARRVIVAALKILLAIAIAAFMVYAVVTQWSQVRQTWLGLAWQSVLLSFVALILGMLANVMAWKASLKDLEHDVPFISASQINFIGALGKYLPGSVWAYVMQMELGRRAGLPRARAFLASVVTVGLGTTAALGLGTLAVPALISSTGDNETYAEPVRFALYAMIALLPVAIICAVPPVLTRLVQLLLRLLRRPPLTHSLTWSGVLRVVGWAAIGWICFGVHLWLLANAQAAPGVNGLIRSVGAFALALTISLFAIFAPSGLGVREAVLVAALVPALPAPNAAGTALGIALASRILFVLADALTAAGAAVSIAVRRRTQQRSEPVAETSS
ncbi:lysylphosphatidylglycerol synthase domain-containing protein [Dactylosporangium sp. NPDC000555]|uniref:lysylphosphatidylglycerol synthase domain-containing protein n=1 Tax=Dactylosporangium sp. NPDC000555 TaxID=3154260 RepID=UPI0033308468